MKLIKNLSTKSINNHRVRIGLFWCNFCQQEVEKDLSNGLRDKSCGCAWHNKNKGDYKHGWSKTRLYRIHHQMKQRILNINNDHYKNYGGRGIKVCDEWINKDNGFIQFKDCALKNGYQEELQLNRIDNNGGYYPENCRWDTIQENSRNRRTNKLTLEKAIEIRNLFLLGIYTKTELGEKYVVNRITIHNIINNIIWRNK